MNMKKAYIAPKSVIYNVDAEAPIAASDLSDQLTNEVPMSDINTSLNPEDNQFTKSNKMWDSQW